jgi:hypothetical protein
LRLFGRVVLDHRVEGGMRGIACRVQRVEGWIQGVEHFVLAGGLGWGNGPRLRQLRLHVV